jgi:hypothetical protein
MSLISGGIESFRETKDATVTYLGWLIDAECIPIDEFRTQSPQEYENRVTETCCPIPRTFERDLDAIGQHCGFRIAVEAASQRSCLRRF